MCFTTGYVQGSDLSKMMLSSNSLSWPEPVKKNCPKPRSKNSSLCSMEPLQRSLRTWQRWVFCFKHIQAHVLAVQAAAAQCHRCEKKCFPDSVPELLKCRVLSFCFEQL